MTHDIAESLAGRVGDRSSIPPHTRNPYSRLTSPKEIAMKTGIYIIFHELKWFPDVPRAGNLLCSKSGDVPVPEGGVPAIDNEAAHGTLA